MKNRKVFYFVMLIILIFLIVFVINKIKTGNNTTNKSADEIEKYILNINSYEIVATVKTNSNKNINTYKIKQQYVKNQNIYKQEVLEPDNIKGIITCYDGEKLSIINNNLNLSIIYEKYPFIINNNLCLEKFIEEYCREERKNIKETEKEIILSTNNTNIKKDLYINKKTNNITKMVIENITQKTSIYIEYNEIKINSLQKEDIIAFKEIEFAKTNI